MLPDRVSNPGPLTYESGTLPIVLRGPAKDYCAFDQHRLKMTTDYTIFLHNVPMVCVRI